MVEPVLFYCSGIWGTKTYSVINSVQNKAAKSFMSVGRYTSNTAVRGDMGWTSCFTKQRTACVRLLCRILRSDDTRLTRRITEWTTNRQKTWYTKVKTFVQTIDANDIVNDIRLSAKTVMRTICERYKTIDNDEFIRDLFNDTNNIVNGNKLRTYRLYKNTVKTEKYLRLQIPKRVRRTVALFRSGSLPLAIETGRYARPRIPIDDRLCKHCDINEVESERHFMMVCPLYDDMRFELFEKAKTVMNDFETLDINSKFLRLMSCDEIQLSLSFSIFNFF